MATDSDDATAYEFKTRLLARDFMLASILFIVSVDAWATLRDPWLGVFVFGGGVVALFFGGRLALVALGTDGGRIGRWIRGDG